MKATLVLKNGGQDLINQQMDYENIDDVIEKIDHRKQRHLTTEEIIKNSIDDLFGETDFSDGLTALDQMNKAILLNDKAKVLEKIIEKQKTAYNFLNNYNLKKQRRNMFKLEELFNENPKEITTLYNELLFDKYLEEIEKIVGVLMQNLSRRSDGPIKISKAMKILKNIESVEEIEKIMPILYENEASMFFERDLTLEKKRKQLYAYRKDVYLDILSSEVIKNYFVNLLADKDLDDVFAFIIEGFNSDNPIRLILKLDSNFNQNEAQKEMLKYSAQLLPEILAEYFRRPSNSLCWKCTNSYVTKCPKIADIEKQGIDKYTFITQGFQLIKDKKIDKFIITKCDNYEEESSDHSCTFIEDAKNLVKAYYGVNTDEELRREKAKLLRRF